MKAIIQTSHLSYTFNFVRDWKIQDHIVKTTDSKTTGTPSANQFPLKGAKGLMWKSIDLDTGKAESEQFYQTDIKPKCQIVDPSVSEKVMKHP